MAFTEFCCRASGSNLNSGTRTGNSTEPGTSADFTYASGNWVQGTGVFTVASGNPSSDGVAVGDFASVYPDGASVAVFIGRVTARDATTITVSLTVKSGTAPTDGTGNRTLKIGGAWLGPNAASGFPFNFASDTMVNAAGDKLRVNLKNDASYSITSGITHSGFNRNIFQGYTTAYGDGGMATIDASTNLIDCLTISSSDNLVEDIIFVGSAVAGTTGRGLVISGGQGNMARRIVTHGFRNEGIAIVAPLILDECEVYDCQKGNNASRGGILVAASAIIADTIVHDCAGSNAAGIRILTGTFTTIIGCILDTNGAEGIAISQADGAHFIEHCDLYNNGSDGIRDAGASGSNQLVIRNCNLVKNGGYGINGSGAGTRSGRISNCGFGAGTQANTSGTTTGLKGIIESGSVNYASNVTPWVDPANGDFRINLAAAKNAGRETFTQTAASYAGAVGYPDIGAAQHAESAAQAYVIGS